jgi:hypothetical protein
MNQKVNVKKQMKFFHAVQYLLQAFGFHAIGDILWCSLFRFWHFVTVMVICIEFVCNIEMVNY